MIEFKEFIRDVCCGCAMILENIFGLVEHCISVWDTEGDDNGGVGIGFQEDDLWDDIPEIDVNDDTPEIDGENSD